MNDIRHIPRNCILCQSSDHVLLEVVQTPKDGENTFGLKDYYRELWRCQNCGLFSNRHAMTLEVVYSGCYREASYGGDKMRSRFDKIMGLPLSSSDNRQRVQRVLAFMSAYRPSAIPKCLDVGSGTAVFPAVMKQAGWDVLAVDPDPKNVLHAQTVAKVGAIQGMFPKVKIDTEYPLITFNKVLEHIQDVVECLSGAQRFLTRDGIVYIELPDGESALEEGLARQEFFLEHFYIFSAASIALLSSRAGYRLLKLERIRDPSGKFTLAAFLAPQPNTDAITGFGSKV